MMPPLGLHVFLCPVCITILRNIDPNCFISRQVNFPHPGYNCFRFLCSYKFWLNSYLFLTSLQSNICRVLIILNIYAQSQSVLFKVLHMIGHANLSRLFSWRWVYIGHYSCLRQGSKLYVTILLNSSFRLWLFEGLPSPAHQACILEHIIYSHQVFLLYAKHHRDVLWHRMWHSQTVIPINSLCHYINVEKI